MEEKRWVGSYIRELDRNKRKEILDAAIEAEGMSPDNELRKQLFEARYQERGGQKIDTFIRGWMNLYYLQAALKGIFGRRKAKKEIKSICADWQMDLCKSQGEMGEEVLYQELVNMSLVYFDLCKSDHNYSSIVLGLGRMKDESVVGKIARDVYRLAYEVPRDCEATDEMAVFTKAATDAFCQAFDTQSELLTEKVAKFNA